MHTESPIVQALQPQHSGAGRFDIYSQIHKALRAFLTDTLHAVGRMDCEDADEVTTTLAQVDDLLATCAAHLYHENVFVHPAVEAGHLGASADIEAEHREHSAVIARLRAAVRATERCQGNDRTEAAQRLYRALALFNAENFVHMNIEETHHNTALWAGHSDAVLMEIEHAIIASIPPQDMMLILRWMIPALNAAERANFLAGARAGMPAEAFAGVLELARRHLSPRDWEKLSRSLELNPAQGLAECA